MKCNMFTRDLNAGNKQTCNYMCDVTTGTTELKIRSSTSTAENPAICDIIVF